MRIPQSSHSFWNLFCRLCRRSVRISKLDPNYKTTGTISSEDQIKVNFVNVFEMTMLPETGGPGLAHFTTSSIAILAIGIAAFWLHRRCGALE